MNPGIVRDTIKAVLVSKGVSAANADKRARELLNDGMTVLRESMLAAARKSTPPDLYQCQIKARSDLLAWAKAKA